MAVTSWAGWAASGSSPAPVIMSNGVVRIEDASTVTNPRLRRPILMAGGQRITLDIEARVLSGRGYIFADLIAGDRTETITMRALDDSTRDWRGYSVEIVCPLRYDQAVLVYVSIGMLRADVGVAEYRNWRIRGAGQQLLTPYVRDGWVLDPVTGVRLLYAGDELGRVVPGDRLATESYVQAAYDARFDMSRDVDARAYISYASPGAAEAVKSAINTFVLGLKSDGLWAKIEHLYLAAAPSLPAMLTDVKNPSVRAQIVGAYEFSPYSGLVGDSSTGYVLTAYSLSTRSLFQLNNAHMMVDVLTSNSELAGDIGTLASGTSYIASLASGTFAARLNAASNTAIPVASAIGFHVVSRSTSTHVDAYVDGVKTTVAQASTSVTNSPLTLLRSGGGVAGRKISMASIGSALTEAEVTAFKARAATFKAAMASFII